MSEEKKTIFAKFLAAQAELQNVAKDQRAKAGQASYRYADISDVLAMVRPVLNRHGLCLMQRAETTEHTVTIETFLYDADGAELRSGGFTVSTNGLMQKGVQAHGSAVTYARRYSLVTFLGVAYGDDDDGQKAVAGHVPPPKKESFVHATAEMIEELEAVANQGTGAFQEWFKQLDETAPAAAKELRSSSKAKELWSVAKSYGEQ